MPRISIGYIMVWHKLMCIFINFYRVFLQVPGKGLGSALFRNYSALKNEVE